MKEVTLLQTQCDKAVQAYKRMEELQNQFKETTQIYSGNNEASKEEFDEMREKFQNINQTYHQLRLQHEKVKDANVLKERQLAEMERFAKKYFFFVCLFGLGSEKMGVK